MLNEIGLVGLGVMGKNIALNLSDKGITVSYTHLTLPTNREV